MFDNLKKRFQKPMWLSNRKLLQLLMERIDKLEKCMNTALQALIARTLQIQAVDAAAATALQGIKTELDAALSNQDWAQVQALSDQLGTSGDALATAIATYGPTGATGGDGGAGGTGGTGGDGGNDTSNPNSTPNSINR